MSELRTHSLRHNTATGQANIQMHADGSTTIRNLQNLANNVIINGEMTVSQYGNLSARSANSSVAACDRWIQRLNLISAQFAISQDDATPPGYSKSLQWACTTQDGSLGAGEFAYIAQRIEGQNAQVFAKGTSSPNNFAVSFWVRSTKTGTYAFRMIDQKNNRMVGRNYTVNSANTWERKSFVIAGESTNAELDNNNTSQLELRWWLAAGSERLGGTVPETWRAPTNPDSAAGQTVNLTDSTNNRFFITGVQLTATDSPIEFQHEDYGTTLSKCQRYFYRNVGGETFTRFGLGSAGTSVSMAVTLKHPVRMRALPTLQSGGNFQVSDQVAGTPTSGPLNLIANTNGYEQSNVSCPVAGGLIAHRPYFLEAANNTGSYYEFSAEL